MQQQIKNHRRHSMHASLQLDDVVFGGSNSSHSHHADSSTAAKAMSAHYNSSGGFSASSNNNGNFPASFRSAFDRDFESRERMDGGTNPYLARGRSSCPSTFHAGRSGSGQQHEYNADRRNATFGMMGGNYFGHLSSFHSDATGVGGSSEAHQQQELQQRLQSRRVDSLTALPQLHDNNAAGGVGDETEGQQPSSSRRDSPRASTQDKTSTTINTTCTESDDKINATFTPMEDDSNSTK